MQVKKFEAPSMQEALNLIKNELGPEAIILSTKQNRKGFGLLSKASVEVTAAVSEKSLSKKNYTERMIPKETKKQFEKLPAKTQSEIYDNYAGYITERKIENQRKTQEAVERHNAQASTKINSQKPAQITKQKYSDILDDSGLGVSADANNYKRNGTITSKINNTQLTAGTAAYVSPVYVNEITEKAQEKSNEISSELFEEIQKLKNIVAEMKSEGNSINDSKARENDSDELSEEFQHLLRNGIDKKLASMLIKHVRFGLSPEELNHSEKIIDSIAVEMMSQIKVSDPLEGLKAGSRKGPEIIALIGPTGVGKTTTIAKIASQAILNKGLKVGLINVDSYKVAALDQMATYAKILNVPFRQASNPAELERALAEFKPLDLVLIDTSGRSQRDSESLSHLKQLLDFAKNSKNILIMSATTRDQELNDIVNRFKVFQPTGIAFSKLDESTTFGSVYNMGVKTQLPLNYFTVGQRVPEDIELASRERLAALILDL